MAPSSERRLPRPSVEARVQLDRVELLCVAAEPVCGCQRGLVQDGVPVVVAPSRGPDPDFTHSSPIAAFYPRVMLELASPRPDRLLSPIDGPPVAASRPPENPAARDSGFHRAGGGNRIASTLGLFALGKGLNILGGPDVVLADRLSVAAPGVRRSACGTPRQPVRRARRSSELMLKSPRRNESLARSVLASMDHRDG
jgi:hypothetical protein